MPFWSNNLKIRMYPCISVQGSFYWNSCFFIPSFLSYFDFIYMKFWMALLIQQYIRCNVSYLAVSNKHCMVLIWLPLKQELLTVYVQFACRKEYVPGRFTIFDSCHVHGFMLFPFKSRDIIYIWIYKWWGKIAYTS